jgi:transcriptional regulator with XRE-family HTH domain
VPLKKLPTATDQEVGKKISFYRRGKKLTQLQLAKQISVTHQQLQKYEQGRNRITVGKLAEIATVLDVQMNSFFDTSREQKVPNDNAGVPPGITLTHDALLMTTAFLRISAPAVRHRLLELVQTIAAKEAVEELEGTQDEVVDAQA